MIRILGIDPGSLYTGYGIIDCDSNHSTHIDNGVIDIKDLGLTEKMGEIQIRLAGLIDQFQPGEIAIERVFVHKNADSALKLGQARGAAIAACAQRQLEVFEYTANQIKQATVGKGHAAKHQVQHMVKILLCLGEIPATDAADALAVALCHAHSREGLLRMQGIRGFHKGRLR